MPIHYEQDDEHIVLITIDRPEARNSADMEHFKLLREAWDRFDGDDSAWVAIITGVEDTFFVGADLKKYIPEITKYQQEIAEKGLQEIGGYRLDDGTKAVLRGAKIWKPIIAAVNGFCAAGGMEMLGGADIRVACPEAQFAVMEPKRGLFAGGGTTVRLPRQIPFPLAMEFLLCADLIPAERAYEMGLLNAVVPREDLLDAAYALRAPHHGQRAARGAGDQAERVGGPGHEPAGRVQERERDLFDDLPDRGRQGGPEGVRREAQTELAGEVSPASRSAGGSGHEVRTPERPGMTDPRSPCLIGVSTRTWHPDDVGEAGAPEPLVMWEEVARAAAADSGLGQSVLDRLDAIDVVYTQTWQYDDPASRLADRLGVDPKRKLYSGIGGTTPQLLVQNVAEQILRSELDVALVVGAEALATQKRFKQRGERYPYSYKPEEKRPFPWEAPFHPAEVAHEVFQAWLTFAVFDNAPPRPSRHGPRRLPARSSVSNGLGSPGSPPRTRRRGSRSSGPPRRSSPRRRTTAWSDTRTRSTWCRSWTSTWPAALLLASHEAADAMGVPADQRVYLRGWCYATDPVYVAEHVDLWRSPAMVAAIQCRARGCGGRHRRRRASRPVLLLRLVGELRP